LHNVKKAKTDGQLTPSFKGGLSIKIATYI